MMKIILVVSRFSCFGPQAQRQLCKFLKYWIRLIAGGLCLPFIFPWLVYQLYSSNFRHKVHRDKSLVGKIVLVTGASSGLGEALAHACFKAGCKVILASRRKKKLERVKKDLISLKTKWPSYEPYILSLDLNDLKDIPAKAEEALHAFGKIDILINNSGVNYKGEIINTSIDIDVKLMVVNYFGHVALIKSILPSMIKAGNGHIVSVSNASSFSSSYAASEHAKQAFFEVLRAELASTNIHVVNLGYLKIKLPSNGLQNADSKYKVIDQTTAEGMNPDEAADCVLNAVNSGQNDVIFASLTPKLAGLLYNFFPSVYFYLTKNKTRRCS
ncbi:dehydrogenase/reductase SDR family protein 7-like isoform X3 [Limulus polyphemus]|nr:dehydrogenase/reductase SDR family protein 7-like isoform X3 [Limulus polyphemus]